MSLLTKHALCGLIFAGLFFSSSSFASSTCKISPTHQSFNVEGLKSELMVTALSCQAQDKYNGFIGQFRSVINEEQDKLKILFRKNYGRRAQKEQDDYITQLANVQSSEGLKAGTIFCRQRVNMFDEIKPLKTAEELSEYADAKNIMQPASVEVCEAPSVVKSKTGRKRHITRHKVAKKH
ncbi:hypothetical protein COMNV_01594 [Commensalibacter sp. Nvir]|uniref:hypothetical protein n=1 Tax=Commensalibacter sp. Nvir TaxID=3069817 RepID=UPI002D469290|nr:hypothetical protein COMNV_01594 [Commensalibacter sp. Nvir]